MGTGNSITLKVKTQGGVNACGVSIPPKLRVTVTHYDDYGVLVSGTDDVVTARKALTKVGYDLDDFSGGYRPTMVDQEPSKWPFGLWVGGTPAVAFYFYIGG